MGWNLADSSIERTAQIISLYAEFFNACSVSVPTMNFGTYTGALSTPGATPMTVTCGFLTSYSVALNAGVGAGATTTTRKMTGPGSATLNYQMFQNSSRTTNWGNTSDTESGSGTGSAQTLQIYRQAAAGQTVQPGTYTDTITVTVTPPSQPQSPPRSP